MTFDKDKIIIWFDKEMSRLREAHELPVIDQLVLAAAKYQHGLMAKDLSDKLDRLQKKSQALAAEIDQKLASDANEIFRKSEFMLSKR